MKTKKPTAKLIGQDGNIFNLMGIASKELKKAGMQDQATAMIKEVEDSGSYMEALAIIMKYVDVE